MQNVRAAVEPEQSGVYERRSLRVLSDCIDMWIRWAAFEATNIRVSFTDDRINMYNSGERTRSNRTSRRNRLQNRTNGTRYSTSVGGDRRTGGSDLGSDSLLFSPSFSPHPSKINHK